MLDIEIRFMQEGEEEKICDLVVRTFDRFVAPGYSIQGEEEFLKYANPRKLLERAGKNHFTLAAWLHSVVVGMIEVRDYRHISMFFVDQIYQGQGIGKNLHQQAIEICLHHNPDLECISVFSSPFAVPIYEKLGFETTGPDQYQSGIHFIPMVLKLKKDTYGTSAENTINSNK